MVQLLDILEEYVMSKGFIYRKLVGSTSSEERAKMIDEFNVPNSEIFVFLLSTRAGGQGVNLQTADTVIIFDSDWNPMMDEQAIIDPRLTPKFRHCCSTQRGCTALSTPVHFYFESQTRPIVDDQSIP
jgi:hypothetical protein